jgi:hypothetical protein
LRGRDETGGMEGVGDQRRYWPACPAPTPWCIFVGAGRRGLAFAGPTALVPRRLAPFTARPIHGAPRSRCARQDGARQAGGKVLVIAKALARLSRPWYHEIGKETRLFPPQRH